MASQPRMGHQDRAYASRVKRLRERANSRPRINADAVHFAAILNGMLDILADLVADQEEAERSK